MRQQNGAECGGNVAKDFAVLEVFRRYREFKPQGIAELNEGGEKLAMRWRKKSTRSWMN